jgi:hypothetical protein
MTDSDLASWIRCSQLSLAVVLGTNEIASAVAIGLTAVGYSTILSHDPFPPVMRRAMAFHDALFGDRAVVERVEGERAETAMEIAAVLAKPGHVAVTPLQLTDLIAVFSIKVLVDARMQKHRITPDFRGIAVCDCRGHHGGGPPASVATGNTARGCRSVPDLKRHKDNGNGEGDFLREARLRRQRSPESPARRIWT